MAYGWEILIASSIGFIGGYVGIAGAPFIVFSLYCFLDYSQHSAQGTVLAMMLGPMSLIPVIYGRNIVRRRWREILIGVITYMAFSFFGGQIAYLFTSSELTLLFGIFIVILGIITILFADRQHDSNPTERIPLFSMAIIGMLIGTIGGMTGIGAGILLMPILTMYLRLEYHEAQTMSLAILTPPVSLGAVVSYGIMENDVVWPAWGWMLLGYFITSGFGYRLSFRHNTLVLKFALSFLLIGAGIIDIVNAAT